MIVPSIDLQAGNAVQLVGGKERALDAGDPRPLAERFARVGEVAVIDLDAALGQGSNAATIEDLLALAPCRVGGGIRDVASARRWLDAGARKVVLGTAAVPEVLRQLPPDRVVAALDAVDGEVVTHGWRTRTGASVPERMEALREYVGGFLVTFVEREGRLGGTALERVPELVEAAGDARLTIAGGVTTPEEIEMLDRLGCDAQVGMALYTGRLDLADAFAAPLVSDRPDGLWPTLVTDERGVALGLAYSDAESLREALRTGRGVYRSRKRGLWIKGESSGATQQLLRVEVDCDRDTLRFTVRQAGEGFCHEGTWTCFGQDRGLGKLEKTLAARVQDAPAGSYTRKLLDDPALLGEKLREEADELARAATPDEVAWEAADVLYFALVACARAGVSLADVEGELDRRSLAVTRRSATEAPAVQEAPERLLRTVRPSEVPSLRRQAVDADTLAAAGRIVQAVRRDGVAAVRAWGETLGDLQAGDPLVIEAPALRAALEGLPAKARSALERTADRVRAFAEAQRAAVPDFETGVLGGRAGIRLQPVERAGCYAPGGRFPLPSSVLMTAVTARAAGVSEVWVASPRPAEVTQAAAALAGADALLAVGGAQAIAALAYGVGVPACDAIVGPGNRWVTAAKQLVAGEVAIDMLAGPSELVVVADGTADPATVAADLLAQAEHDPDAVPILVALDPALPAAVEAALADQLATLPTAPTARAALRNGFAVLASDDIEAADLCDRLAPEHLALHVVDPPRLAARLHHYGALFVGEHAAEVLGDYGAGPNHVLPTGGTARYVGALSVLTFLRTQTWLRIDDPAAAAALATDAATVARLEGLEAHARSAGVRM